MEDNNITGEFQAGFKRKYSTIDHMFTLLSFVQKQFSLNRKLYVAFIDFEKAFDSINRSILWPILLKNGVQGKLLKCIMSMYDGLRVRIRSGGAMTDYIRCTSGVKQGDVCSPILFSLFINELTSKIMRTGRHGAQFIEDFMQIFILLLADDIVLLSETITGLQTQLNNLYLGATSLQLKVNMSKSNIIVFRKGGYLKAREHWNYNGSVMPVVNIYKYLGIYFSTRLFFTAACKDLASRAKRAAICVMKNLNRLGNSSFKVFTKIFDSQVQPVAQYGAEIWGLDKCSEHIEKIHLFALKRFLGVSKKTPNNLIYGETNRYPIYINSAIKCIQYWLKLTRMDGSRLPRKAYNMLYNLDARGKVNWVTKVRVKLCESGFGYVWMNQGVENISEFTRMLRIRLIDSRWQLWSSQIQSSDRFDLYRQFNLLHNIPTYLTMGLEQHLKYCMTRFRFGISDINVHRFRYSNHSDNNNICPLCRNAEETETHFVLCCPVLETLRRDLIPTKFYKQPSSFKLVLLMASCQEDVVKRFVLYLYKSFKLRSFVCS